MGHQDSEYSTFGIPPSSAELMALHDANTFVEAIKAEVERMKAGAASGAPVKLRARLHGGDEIDVLELAPVGSEGVKILGTTKGRECTVFVHQAALQLIVMAERSGKATQ